MILRINVYVLFALLAVPLILLFKGMVDNPILKFVLLELPLLITVMWFYAVNQVQPNQAKNPDQKKKILLLAALLFSSTIIEVFILKSGTLFASEIENKMPFIYLLSIIQLTTFILLFIRTYKHLKLLFPERSKWFLFLELLTCIVAIINLTPEIQELEKSNRFSS